MLQIYTIPVTPFSQNARILYDPVEGNAVVVDPGGDIDLLLAELKRLKPSKLQVVLTHAHIDHAGGTVMFQQLAKQEFGEYVSVAAHADSSLRSTISRQAKLFGLPADEYQNAPEPDVVLAEGDTVDVGGHRARVAWVPGHAPDHITLFFDVPEFELHEEGSGDHLQGPVLVAGDTLFAGSIGRTDLPGGSLPQLLGSIREKLLVLPEETVVLCGHGPSTTIGEEKRFNPFLQE